MKIKCMYARRRLLLSLSLIAMLAVLPDAPLAEPPAHAGSPDDAEFDATSPDTPLPPGFRQRVFIHLPRTGKPNHLGTCAVTKDDNVNHYGLAGWRLPDGGITWHLSDATVPSSVGASVAVEALSQAFGAWTAVDPNKVFIYGGPTTVRRPRLDFINTVMWGRISAGAIAITYIRYQTATGIVVDVDTVFNSRYPWAAFLDSGDCSSLYDAYDVQNIATHEFGHWVGLDDLYSTDVEAPDTDLTMYGYGAGGELKKRTLGTGDKTGANAVAP
jgi:hypothetical protein